MIHQELLELKLYRLLHMLVYKLRQCSLQDKLNIKYEMFINI